MLFSHFDGLIDEWQYAIAPRKIKLKWFQIRRLYRIIATNVVLVHTGIKNNITRSFCRKERDYINHIFWSCTYVKSFWEQFQTAINAGCWCLHSVNMLCGLGEYWLYCLAPLIWLFCAQKLFLVFFLFFFLLNNKQIIIPVISIAPYLIDKGEHTALYKINKNV